LSGTDGAIKTALARVGVKAFEAADVDEWRRGWRIVAGAAVGLGTGISLYLMVASLFIGGLTAEYGWSRGDMGTAGALAFIVGAVSLSIVGKIIDRVGFRPVVLVCAPALALLYVVIALQPGAFGFYLALMVWGGVFGAGTGAIAYTRPVVAAFVRQRGLALGVATCGV
jgi:sugar phosphate permease